MQLMTQEIEKKLEDVVYYPKVDDWDEAEVIVKYFNPYGAGTWLIVGGEKDGDEWILYGYAEIGQGWEWGSVFLHELQEYRSPLFGLGIERDLYCEGQRVKDLINFDASRRGKIK